MCDGISLNLSDIPDELVHRHSLRGRIVRRGPDSPPEIHFLQRERPRILPAWYHSRLEIFRWGNLDGHLRELPWVNELDEESLSRETWHIPFEKVLIPASLGLERGIWYQIREGIEGVVVTVHGERILFPLQEDSSHYFRVMTRSDQMPLFVGERI